MAVPKQKISKSRRGQRQSHKKVIKINVIEDPKTGELRRPHHVGPDGTRSGVKVTDARVNV